MKNIFFVMGSILLVTFSSASLAVGPGSGTLTKYNIRIGKCQVESITAKWRLDSMMGEALVSASYKWKGDDKCKLPYTTVMWLKVVNSSGGYGSVRVSPVTPKANRKFGYNTTGSPNWGKTLCGYQGTRTGNCMSKDSAKRLWKTGRVTDFTMVW